MNEQNIADLFITEQGGRADIEASTPGQETDENNDGIMPSDPEILADDSEDFEIISSSECTTEDTLFEWIEWEELVAGEIPDEEGF